MMSIFAAVTTGQGAGPIATIQIFGESAESVIRKIFKAADNKPATLKTGKILLGEIADGNEIIDQVTIGCEEPNSFAINCHGNPLIVEMIMKLLRQNGVKLLSAEQLLAKILAGHNTIVIEAELTQPKVKTIEGAKIIANQINAGLNGIAKSWLENTNTMTLKEIADQVKTILQNSKTAKMIIYGCTIAIAGPPNTGKSTLLNCLCGRPKAIVADIKGTTRDWVSAQCRMGELSAELIDTAGLDETLAAGAENTVERQAQQKTIQILETADLVLLVLDNSQAAEQLDGKLLEKIAGKKIAVILADTEMISYGTIDVAVGSSGVNPCSIMFGKKDKFGKPKFGGVDLVGQEITAASALLFGQTDAGIPVTIIRGYDYQFDEKRNVSNTMRFSGGEKGVLQTVGETMRLTSYAINGLGKKFLLRIGSWFVR